MSSDKNDAENMSSDKNDAENKSLEQNDAENKSSDKNDAENMSSDTNDAEKKSLEQNDAENKSLDQNVVENKSSDQTVAENKSSDQNIAENKSSDQNVAEKKSSDRNVAENKSSDQTDAENKSSDQNVAENKSSDQNVAENKSSDQSVAENKSSDKNDAENKSLEQNDAENMYSDKNDAENMTSDKNDAENKSLEQNDAENMSSDKNDAENMSSDKNDAENKSLEQNDAENMSSDKNDAENMSSDKNDAENKSLDQNFAENKSSDQNVAVNKSSDQNATENKSLDRNVAENKSSDQNDTENKSLDQNATENKSSDQSVAENKSSDKNDAENKSLEQNDAENMSSDKNDAENKSLEQNDAENMSSDKNDVENMSSDKNDAENKSSDQNVAENKSLDKNATENKSSDHNVAENKSLDQNAAENKSLDQNATENKSSDQNVAENKSSDQNVAENKSSDQNATENKSSGQNVAENKSSDQNATENKSSGQNVAENKSSDQNATENKSSGQNVAENKSSDQNATENKSSELSDAQEACKDDASASDASACLSTTRANPQTSGTNVMAHITGERYRLQEYEAEISGYIHQLLKGQEDINTMADSMRERILKKHSECLALLEKDKKSLLEQLDSVKEEKLSENEPKLQEAISYLQKITDRKTELEEILINKGTVEANDEFTKSLLLLIHFQRPIPSLANVSFHESSSWTGTDNILGRLKGLINIARTQTEPTLTSYMKFLWNIYSRTTDAKKIHWKMTISNEVEIKNLYDLKILQGVHNEMDLSRADKKWNEVQQTHVKMASLLYEVTIPTSESSSEKLERHLTELQRNIGKLWNTIQFHINYKNSERGLIPEGFQNYGNTCYFNSVLQCLLQTVLLPFELTVNIYGLENVLAEKKEMYCLSKAFMELASKYNESEQRKRALKTLYSTFTRATQRFSDGRQHDSHDLLIHFLDKLRVEERNASKIPSAGPETQKMLTAVDRIFGGQFITVYTCHRCEEPYAIREPFLDISIPLCMLTPDEQKPEESKIKPTTTSESKMAGAPKSISAKHDKSNEEITSGTSDAESQQRQLADVGSYAESHFSCETNLSSLSAIDDSRKASSTRDVIKNVLQPIAFEALAEPEAKTLWSRVFKASPNVSQCLKYFTRAEMIDSEYLCRNCQTPGSDELRMTSATKRTLISSPPAILVLHLKRFEQTAIGFVKRDEMISYEELLDLGPFCSCSALRIDPEEANVWYSLYAVVVHSGLFLSQGHYVAYVKQRDSSAQLDDQMREKFLQKSFGDREKVPNDDDLAAMEKRKAIKKREKAKRPDPIPGQWIYISDDSVRPSDAKKALDQKAFLLFYERIPGTYHKSTGV